MHQIDVRGTGPHEYAVVVTTGGTTTSHRVSVPETLRQELGIAERDEDRLVHESFAFLLEREPAGSILREFSLVVISRYFPDYLDEINTRLGRGGS